jgi:hypothetical protein
MNCPYCQSTISSRAQVCPQCTRDLWLIKPLQEEVLALQQKVAELELNWASRGDSDPQGEPAETTILIPSVSSAHASAWLNLTVAAVLSIAAVLLLHWLLLFVFDTNPLVLRLATILAPALISAFALWIVKPNRLALVMTSLLAGLLAVSGMLIVTGLLDNVPITPQNLRDGREALEYVLAIALGFLTGALTASLRQHLKQRKDKAPSKSLLDLVQRDAHGRIHFDDITEALERWGTVVGPVVSGGMALYAGVKSLMG